MIRDLRLQVRISQEELDLIKQAAALAHMNVSEYARLMLLIGSRGAMMYDEVTAQDAVRQASFVLFGKTVPRDQIQGLEVKEDTEQK